MHGCVTFIIATKQNCHGAIRTIDRRLTRGVAPLRTGTAQHSTTQTHNRLRRGSLRVLLPAVGLGRVDNNVRRVEQLVRHKARRARGSTNDNEGDWCDLREVAQVAEVVAGKAEDRHCLGGLGGLEVSWKMVQDRLSLAYVCVSCIQADATGRHHATNQSKHRCCVVQCTNARQRPTVMQDTQT
jgi:hypothetical protein